MSYFIWRVWLDGIDLKIECLWSLLSFHLNLEIRILNFFRIAIPPNFGVVIRPL